MFSRDQASFRALRGHFAERTRPLLAWMGAGVSASAGLPNWVQLIDLLAEAAKNKAEALGLVGGSGVHAKLAAYRKQGNPWDQMQILKEALGESTFTSVVKSALGRADTCDPPALYGRIWKLGVKGLLTLNLDRFAARSFTKCFPSKVLVEFSGLRAGEHLPVLEGRSVSWPISMETRRTPSRGC